MSESPKTLAEGVVDCIREMAEADGMTLKEFLFKALGTQTGYTETYKSPTADQNTSE
jgi:hypothetical protein